MWHMCENDLWRSWHFDVAVIRGPTLPKEQADKLLKCGPELVTVLGNVLNSSSHVYIKLYHELQVGKLQHLRRRSKGQVHMAKLTAEHVTKKHTTISTRKWVKAFKEESSSVKAKKMEWNGNGRAEWFMTSLVVRKILDHFSNSEILSFSLVNKIWNSEAKSLLKVRGSTCARIGTITLNELVRSVHTISDELREKAEAGRAQFNAPLRNIQANACEDVINLSRLMESMGVIPFRKLNFQIRDNHPGPCVPFDEDAVRLIIQAVPITSLSFSLLKSTEGTEGKQCHAISALRLVLKANAHQLSKIFIGAPTELTLDPHALLNGFYFSQLRILVFDLCDLPNRPAAPEMLLLNTIVRKSENLEYLELRQSLENHPRESGNVMYYFQVQEFSRLVMQGSRAMLVLRRDPIEAWNVPENFLNRIAVRYLDALPDSADRVELDARTVLLKNSWWALTAADFDILSLATAFRYRIPYPNMRELSVDYNMLHLGQQFSTLRDAILRSHLWTHCFPNLQKLTFYLTEDEHESDLLTALQHELSDAVMEDDLVSDDSEENCWLQNLQELQLNDVHVDTEEVQFVRKLCPNVTRFSAKFSFDLIELWTDLSRIEYMELDTTDFECNFMDWTLCGLSPHEFKELQGKEPEFLKKVHIVPHETPITHLQHLTELRFNFRQSKNHSVFGIYIWEDDENDDEEHHNVPVPRSRFSKVSAGLCFSRMSNLRIFVSISKPRLSADEEHGFESILEDFPEIDLRVEIVSDEDDE